MQAIENAILIPIKDLLSKPSLGIDLMLAICGAAVIVILFLISLLIKNFSLVKSFTKNLQETTVYLKEGEEITEENVEGLNNRLKTMPETVQKGWGYFLEQRVGYPSDYIQSKDALAERKFSGGNKAGKTFFGIFSAIIIILTIWLEYVISSGNSLSSVGLVDFTKDFKIVGAIIAAFCAPLLVYIILRVILNVFYNKQYKKLEKAFSNFQNVLDAKVIIYDEEEDEFISENIGEINAAIEEILANKLENKEIIEIVTAPKQEEIEILEEVQEEVTEIPEEETVVDEEPIPEEVVFVPAKTEEEKQARLAGLTAIIDEAVYNDPVITKEHIEELAIIIDNERELGLHNDRDRAILEECLIKLAQKHSTY